MSAIYIVTNRRVTVMMITVAIVLFGLVSLARLPVNLLPNLSYPTLTIRTELTGAAPQEIEALLSKLVEEAVGTIDNVRQVRSVSRSGQADVIVEFNWGTSMDTASVEVREKIDVLQLPLEARRPILLRFDPSTEPVLRIALSEQPTSADNTQPAMEYVDEADALRKIRRLAEDRLKNALEAVQGTAAVKVSGGLEDEIQVLLDQDLLAQLNLSVEMIAARLKAENVNLAGGRLEQGQERFLVRTINEFTSIAGLADTIVATVEGRPVYLRDIGVVRQGAKDREAITRVAGAEAVELAVYKEGDANTVLVAGAVNKNLAELRKTLPSNLALTVVSDQSTFINAAIRQVRIAALLGGILAVLVLYGFLGDARSTAIIAVAIPVSIIGTFLAMFATDVTLNIMSLGGIALAIGLLVDNSIVVLENIFRQREAGLDVLRAARRGTAEVASAVFAATLTTVAVFFPMIFVSGIAGQLFRDQALTVTFALLLSLLVALGLIPMLASLAAAPTMKSTPPRGGPSRFTRGVAGLTGVFLAIAANVSAALGWLLTPVTGGVQALFALLRRGYLPALSWCLGQRLGVLLVATLLFAASLALLPRLGTELLPELAQGEFNLKLRAAPGTPLAQTDRLLANAESVAGKLDHVALTYAVAGTGNRLDANPVDAGEHTGNILIRLDPGHSDSEADVMSALRASLSRVAGVEYEFARPALLSLEAPVVVEIAGFDLKALAETAQRVQAVVAGQDRFTDVRSSLQDGNPEIQVVFDQQRAARLGLAVRDVADQVVAGIRGNVATRYTWRDKEIDVVVRTLDPNAASLEEIRSLVVNPTSERPVSLDALADISVAQGPAEIRRVDQSRVALISANLTYGDLGTAVEELQTVLNSLPLPTGINLQIRGQNEAMDESMASLQYALLMAIFLVYLIMASQFESFVHPLVILFTIPLGLIGAVWALFLTATPLNVVAFIGAIMLTGIVVNNAIVLVDLINQLRRQGEAMLAAVEQACDIRLRPIMMTTLTTMLGLLPMAVSLGEGDEIRGPMAITVIGGLFSSTLLTLFVIPVVYSLFSAGGTLAATNTTSS